MAIFAQNTLPSKSEPLGSQGTPSHKAGGGQKDTALMSRIWQSVLRMIAADARRHRHIRDYKILDETPDYLLRDMGLTRGQVVRARQEAERTAFWKL